MLITTGIFVFFYSELISDPDNEGITGIGLILYWMYIIFIISLLVTSVFAIVPFFFKRKDNLRTIRLPLIRIGVLLVLLAGAYLFGNGNPLSIPGYDGNENTLFWLKLTDMWLYTIYILLGLAIIALFGGIIWSYVKRIQ
jgi:heme/copper-type cytochrome/quinol oxidase subunit 2